MNNGNNNNLDINKLKGMLPNEDMSALFDKVSNMVNEGNIPDEMKNILSSISANGNSNSTDSASNSASSIDMDTILKMKSIIEKMNNKDDPRSNLLLSLKPYLKDARKEKVDQYIKMFGMSKVLEAFNSSGGDNQK